MSGLHTVGLVACGKAKLDQPAPARDLYTSPLFQSAAAYAEATYDEWFVTLAAFGQRDRDAWGGRVALALQLRLRHRGLSVPTIPKGQPWPHEPQVEVFLHAGETYARALRWHLTLWPCVVRTPVAGLRIGEQLAWYAERREAA